MDDTFEFHKENMQMNDKHYSFYTKRTPTSVTNWVNNSGAKLYFNPLIPMNTFKLESDAKDLRKFKYGVISAENALKDLT